jgi:hypothetical protein
VSVYPRFLYNTDKAVPLNITLGNPMANQVVGTQRSGDRAAVRFELGKQLAFKRMNKNQVN